jgi:hypothetical protein
LTKTLAVFSGDGKKSFGPLLVGHPGVLLAATPGVFHVRELGFGTLVDDCMCSKAEGGGSRKRYRKHGMFKKSHLFEHLLNSLETLVLCVQENRSNDGFKRVGHHIRRYVGPMILDDEFVQAEFEASYSESRVCGEVVAHLCPVAWLVRISYAS